MKKLLIIFLSIICITTYAQTKKEIKFDNSDGKYHITVITNKDGQKSEFSKTYSSLEEMKNDPELKGLELHVFDKDHNAVFIGEADSDIDMDVDMVFSIDDDENGEGNHQFKFKTEDGEMSKIKVWVDEDGEKHISKDGEEISGNTWTSKDGQTYNIKKGDGKVIIKSGDAMGEFFSEDDQTIEINVEGDTKKVEKQIYIIMSEDGEGTDKVEEKIVVKVIETLNIHLEEIEENEFTEMPGIDAKKLKVDDLNYYPNPNEGRFNLSFNADDKPTELRITSLDGKEVYSESLQTFEGTYNNEIDLSGQERGIYLLQIIQGKKAMNKKIVIE